MTCRTSTATTPRRRSRLAVFPRRGLRAWRPAGGGALLCACVLLAGLGAPPRAAHAEDAVPADAYAVVGSAVIARSAVEAEAKHGSSPAVALQRLVELEVLRVNLRRRGHDPAALSEETVRKELDKTERLLASRGRSLEAVLAAGGRTRSEFEDALRVRVALQRLVSERVRDEDLRADFPRRALRVVGEVRAAHVLVAIDAGRGEAEARAEAERLLASLRDAEDLGAAFARLARERSDDPFGPITDGDLDWFDGRGRGLFRPPHALVEAAFALGAPGLVPEPVRGPRGYHLVRVVAVHLPADATPEALLPAVRADAEAREAAALVEEWLRSTEVRYAPDAPRVPDGSR
ncbi:MAG: hypothetical protein D6731_12430 [Planctomycetota bacterium]|nr:MAG: hypothetical protein D6731_12430 [Planctomycetota bacterium]